MSEPIFVKEGNPNSKPKTQPWEMTRFYQITTLRLSETKFAKRKYKNSFYLRRNRARRAGSATEEFEAEIKAAFNKRIEDAILEINNTCDALLEDESLDIPVTLVARGQGNKSKPIALSKKVPSSSPPLKRKQSDDDDTETDTEAEAEAFVATLKDTITPIKRQKVVDDNYVESRGILDLDILLEDLGDFDVPCDPSVIPPPPPPPAIFGYSTPATTFNAQPRSIAACEQQPGAIDSYDY